jgi:hypothetical protein
MALILGKTSAPQYDQRLMAHYLGHHMTCGNSSMLFTELQILEYIKTEMENSSFNHAAYHHYCLDCGINPAPEYKQKEFFSASITVFKDDRMPPIINVFPEKLPKPEYIPRFFELQYSGSVSMNYYLDVWDETGADAFNQVVSLCKEYFDTTPVL